MRTYVRAYRPAARHDMSFEQFGSDAGHCFTLFPDYWNDSRSAAFVDHTFVMCLRKKARAIRIALFKAMTLAGKEW